jgi:hypothetical protein
MLTNASFSVMKKITLLIILLLLSFTLLACAQTRVDTAQPVLVTADDIKVALAQIAKLANLDSPSIDMKALSVLVQTDFEALVKNNTTQDRLVSVQQIIPSALNSGLVSVSYSKQYAPMSAVQYVESNKRIPPDFDTKYLERVGIVLNPLLLCVKAQDIQKAWETQFKNQLFARLAMVLDHFGQVQVFIKTLKNKSDVVMDRLRLSLILKLP